MIECMSKQRLTYIGPAPSKVWKNGQTVPMGVFMCQCGNETTTSMWNADTGHTKSCGCLRNGHPRHGMSRTPIHTAWAGVRARTKKGGRVQRMFPSYVGVNLDPRWETFEGFLANQPAGRPFSPGMVLARFNDEGNYSPENTRWATKGENARESIERKMIRLSDGRFARDVARENGVSVAAMDSRIRRGIQPDAAVLPR